MGGPHSPPARCFAPLARASEVKLEVLADAPATPRRRLWKDTTLRWIVRAGGVAIIASILAILVFILLEVAPLAAPPDVRPAGSIELGTGTVGAATTDEHRTHVAILGHDGVLRVRRIADGFGVIEKPVAAEQGFTAVLPAQGPLLAGATPDGRIVLAPVRWEVSFAEGRRVVTPSVPEPSSLEMDRERRPLAAFAVRASEDLRAVTAVAQLSSGRIAVLRRETRENLLTGEAAATESRLEIASPGPLTLMELDDDQRNLYAAGPAGAIHWWRVGGGAPEKVDASPTGGSGITALSLLLGGRSLVVGREDGSLSVWYPLRREDGSERLVAIREFPRHEGAIRLLAPSARDKSFLAQDEGGTLGLYHATSHRTLWKGPSPVSLASALVFAPKGDGAIVAGGGRVASLEVRNPHPEISLKALFGRVWYEGYPRPEFVWQSTGGTDDFEIKLSLTPLLFGTFKGTFYSLAMAIPLGVLSAIYAAQFMDPRLRRWLKPTVEIMAALPSVVLGFLAGLWLAPRVERTVPALALMLLVLPATVLGARFLWSLVPRRHRGRLPAGAEIAVLGAAVLVGVALCLALSRPVETLVLGRDFPSWLFETTGIRYDQRNAIVVGLAMGFAVIPIIFAIAEDALSNVPRALSSGALALGATRWQTVSRVVLPTASPGIFAAVMVGFGRAIGETMIVLMATGNTPIMSWSPFDGFRTLSANIAVEIPEAPQGGTLYRTLFLAALLLFVLTFVVNTAAEIVRERLRRRYARL